MSSNQGPTLGVHLLETITKGMYSEPLHSIREYVQNAYDSIRGSRRAGLYGQGNEMGELQIFIDKDNRTVRIRDDAGGLDPEQAAVQLLDLGVSKKSVSNEESEKHAGFRGIGRMAGITYCKTLRFITSNGNGRKCVVVFNAEGINHLTKVGQKPTTIINAIQENSDIDDFPEDPDKHYFEVVLEGVNHAGEIFLNEDRLNDYLGQVAPVAYKPEWSYGTKILDIAKDADSEESLEHILITIRDSDGNTQFDVRRPFADTFTTASRNRNRTVRVRDVISLPRDCDTDKWWGWLATHDREAAMNDVAFSGLRVRMHNIAIGDASIVRALFNPSTSARALWCFGEIHITDYGITPNAQRDNFEDSKSWYLVKSQLTTEAKKINQEVGKESADRNRSPKVYFKRFDTDSKQVNNKIQEGFVSRNEQNSVERDLIEKAEKVRSQKGKRNRSEDDIEQLEQIAQKYEALAKRVSEVKRTGNESAFAGLDRKSRKIVLTIQKILETELDEDTYRRIVKKINSALQPGHKE